MILEIASFKIKAGEARAFETAYIEASKIIAAAKGYISHQMQRSIDVENHYVLLVQWRTLADHVTGFRESPAFLEWRKLLGPSFAVAPEVEHYELLG